ncbi:MAG: hypothetical protein RLZZ277_1240 [Actinomycetota bacterium]|jgi:uncharacterized membrane protein YccC
MFQKLKKAILSRKYWIRQIVVAGIAGAFAWLLGDQLIINGGLVAAIVCTLSIRISLHKSLREGFGQIVGTAIGAGVALLTVSIFDFGFISIGTTIFLCAVVARALHLGEVASVNVPVTALIVIGPGLSESTAIHRLASTLVGAAVAIAFSYFSHPKTPLDRAREQISLVGSKAARLLAEMSEGVAAGYTQKDAAQWLSRGRLLIEEIPAIRAQSVEAKGYARWIRTGTRDAAEEVYIEGLAVEHTVVQVRAIARTLFDSILEGGIADVVKKDVAVALSAASYAVQAHIEDPEDIVGSKSSPTDDAREASSQLSEHLIEDGGDVDQEQIIRGLSIVANIGVIADSLDHTSPTLTDVLTPDEPNSAKVFAVSPVDQTTTFVKRMKKLFSKHG